MAPKLFSSSQIRGCLSSPCFWSLFGVILGFGRVLGFLARVKINFGHKMGKNGPSGRAIARWRCVRAMSALCLCFCCLRSAVTLCSRYVRATSVGPTSRLHNFFVWCPIWVHDSSLERSWKFFKTAWMESSFEYYVFIFIRSNKDTPKTRSDATSCFARLIPKCSEHLLNFKMTSKRAK